MSAILKNINEEVVGFINFLLEKNVFQTGLAFVLATQVNQIFLKFANNIITPIVDKVIEEKARTQTTNIFGVEFKTGEFSLGILNFVLVLLFLYYMYKVSDSSKTLFQNLANKIKNIF